MKAIAINGSPRKRWNTATLLRKATGRGEEKRRGDRVRTPLRLGVQGLHQLLCLQEDRREELRPVRGQRRTHPGPRQGRRGRHPDHGVTHLLSHGDRRDALVHGAPPVPVPYLHPRLRIHLSRQGTDGPRIHHERGRGKNAGILPGQNRRGLPRRHDTCFWELRSSALHGHISVHRLLEVRLHGLGLGRQGQAAPGSVPAGLCEGL